MFIARMRRDKMAVDRDHDEVPVRGGYVRSPEPRFFDQPTAAAYLGISERLFEQQWRAFKMPHPRKIGRRSVWDRKILDHWADVISGLATALDQSTTQDRSNKKR